ncbi:hypothetical protein K6025_01895 [Ehrlichia sp. JZT12]
MCYSFFPRLAFLQITTDFRRKMSAASIHVIRLREYINRNADPLQILAIPNAKIENNEVANVKSAKSRGGPLDGVYYFLFGSKTQCAAITNINYTIVSNKVSVETNNQHDEVSKNICEDNISIIDIDKNTTEEQPQPSTSHTTTTNIKTSSHQSKKNKIEMIATRLLVDKILATIDYGRDELATNENHTSNGIQEVCGISSDNEDDTPNIIKDHNKLLTLSDAAQYVESTSNEQEETCDVDSDHEHIPNGTKDDIDVTKSVLQYCNGNPLLMLSAAAKYLENDPSFKEMLHASSNHTEIGANDDNIKQPEEQVQQSGKRKRKLKHNNDDDEFNSILLKTPRIDPIVNSPTYQSH